ncbi:VLRF1 family aeRF1-type release factor [Shouchella shacheensis]|uniref:VLRF1 family aeRF1-type release factor n=1 Tax=Shouchella shacheensis TaxID=1649580 RepID=UPI000B0265F5|nr:VLRF1 family aeRF1-type release factor [Shouchella shacheensis]
MSLAKNLKHLRQIHCEDGCLSIYLRTNQASTDQQKGEWKIRLKNGLKKLEEYLQASDNDTELKAFQKLKKQAEAQITDLQPAMPKAVVFIGSATGEVQLTKLQVPVENEFRWERQPVVDQLETLQATYPRSGILLIQKTDVIAVETSLGEVEEERTYSWDIETEDWKEYVGSGSSENVGAALHRDQFDDRFDANQQRWFKQLAAKIDKRAKDRGWNSVHLVGSPDQTTEFERQLTFKEVVVVKKNLAKLRSHQIVDEVFEPSA